MKYVRLEHYEFVNVIGPDARKFLQGQVTCDMERVSNTVSLAGALCNLKGRVIADFRALCVTDGIVLQTQLGMAQKVAEILRKYAVFSKVELSTGGFNSSVVGAFGDDTEQQLSQLFGWQKKPSANVFSNDDVIIVTLDENIPRVEIYPLTDAANTALAQLENNNQPCSLSLWDRLDIEAGVFHVDPALSEEFTPQLLNYDISGVVDFKKGCYTGQEIVARMFYRSTPKKRLTLLSSPLPVEPEANVEYAENGASSIAPVLRFSNEKTQESQDSLLLAIIGTQAADSSQPLTLTNNEQSYLQILTMPYTQLKD